MNSTVTTAESNDFKLFEQLGALPVSVWVRQQWESPSVPVSVSTEQSTVDQ